VTYKNFPANAQAAVQYAIDTWSRSFASSVPIKVEASWESQKSDDILGSARAGYYFNAFPGAPDEDTWYPPALANTLAGKDLDPRQSEILLTINTTPDWYFATDGKPPFGKYDLASVVLHEIAHGLGFMSNAQYDRSTSTAFISQPTPFDAYVQLPDEKTFTNFCSKSIELGRAMVNPLFWSGESAITANKGSKPKLYTPSPFEPGSSIAHLDESSFDRRVVDSVMTPNMDQGEVFSGPGPIALAMIEDMLRKPPAGVATNAPSKALNLNAVIGDGYAMLSIDTPECSRVDRIKIYKVTINPGGEVRTFKNPPFRINNLKNGRTYSFTLVSENEIGVSEPVTSNSIKPQSTKKPIFIDPSAEVEHLEATTYQGRPTIFYGDLATQTLKMAVRTQNRWKISTIRKALQVGNISICKTGSGSMEVLHLFYAEVQREDLHHSVLKNKKWDHEIVDGNGPDIQNYNEIERRRTASDVSVSNACAIIDDEIQVFYRDESQGILLGAVQKDGKWHYEIVDGDKDSENRTTGDVAFDLSAVVLSDKVYLIYDSVISIDNNRNVTSGDVRLATRKTTDPNDWIYQTLDGPVNGNQVAGYAVAINTTSDRVTAAWIVAKTISAPTQVSYKDVTKDGAIFSMIPTNFGLPGNPLGLENENLYFSCGNRLCRADKVLSETKLINGDMLVEDISQVIFLNKKKYLTLTAGNRLMLIAL
jgi:hypothetical protein